MGRGRCVAAGVMALAFFLACSPASAWWVRLPPKVELGAPRATGQSRSIVFSKFASRIPEGTPYRQLDEGIFCLSEERQTWSGSTAASKPPLGISQVFDRELAAAGSIT